MSWRNRHVLIIASYIRSVQSEMGESEPDYGLSVNNEVINFNKCHFSRTQLEISSEKAAGFSLSIRVCLSVYI